MINLTIPLYDYLPQSDVFPWDSPFYTENIASYEINEARLFYISFGSQTGTRIINERFSNPDASGISKMDFSTLYRQNVVIVRLPSRNRAIISEKDIRSALENLPITGKENGLLLVTDWGDDKKWKNYEEKYSIESPTIGNQACDIIIEFMNSNNMSIFLTDCYLIDSPINSDSLQEWASEKKWQRPTWPSSHAKSWIRNTARDDFDRIWRNTKRLSNQVTTVLGLANCKELHGAHTEITCLPIPVEGWGIAPCTVVASENKLD